MKKLLIIPLLLFSIVAFSQYLPLGSPVGNNMAGVSFQKTLIMPRATDTTAALILAGRDTLGMMFYAKSNRTVYYRDSNMASGGHKWTVFGSGSGSGTVTDFSANSMTNFATAGVTNSTTTPALTYTLLQANAHRFFGNNTGSAGPPAYLQPSTLDLSDFPSQTGNAGKFFTTNGSSLSWASPSVIDSIFTFITDSIIVNKKLRIPLTDTTNAKKGKGNIIYDTLLNHYYGWDGTKWAIFDASAGTASRFGVSGEDATAAQNRAFAAAGFDFSISGATNFTLSSNNYNLIEGINRTTINSLDSTYLLGANALSLASVNIASRATTSNVWGYTTAKLWTANTSGMFLTGGNFSLAATDKIAHIDTLTGKLTWGRVDQASQITGITPPLNGGTGFSTYTTGDMLYASASNTLSKLAIGSSNQQLTVVGGIPAWATASNYWIRGQYESLATANSNVVQLATAADTLAVGAGIATALPGKNNFTGRTYFKDQVAIQSGYTAYGLTASSVYATNARFDGQVSINAFADPPGTIGLYVSNTNVNIALLLSGFMPSTASNDYSAMIINANPTQTSASAGTGSTAININMINQVDGSANQTSEFYRGMYVQVGSKSASSTPLGRAVGFEALTAMKQSTGETTVTNSYNYWGKGLSDVAGQITAAGRHITFFADTFPSTSYTGASAFGFVQLKNAANTIKNDFQGATSIGGTITNDAASAGYVGEEINSTISSYANYTTTATYQNVTSISLTAGDWDISSFFTYSANAATITAASNAIFVISTTTASAAGATEGQNISYVPQAALLGTSKFSDAISPYRVSLSATTTYYLNTQATFTLGNPQYVGSLRARRIR